MAKSAIANMFPEADTGSTGTRNLSTGMLTYAKGNYPVLGDDGKVYDAKYEGAGMKTGIYGGGAHFGIFSEKQPEMIVDGKTIYENEDLVQYPGIWAAIHEKLADYGFILRYLEGKEAGKEKRLF